MATATPPAAETQPNPADEDPGFNATPENPVKDPSSIFLAKGESGTGKTHLLVMIAKGPVLVCDTEGRADRVLAKFSNYYWKKCLTFGDVRRAVKAVMTKHKGHPGTVIFDSGSDINSMIEEVVVQEMNESNEKIHPTYHWGRVYEKLSKMINNLRDQGWDIGFTGRVVDEYAGNVKSGVRDVSGFVKNKLHYHADFVFTIKVENGVAYAIAEKHGDRRPGTFRTKIEPHELTRDGIRAWMVEPPLNPGFDEKGARPLQAAPAGATPGPTPAPAINPPVQHKLDAPANLPPGAYPAKVTDVAPNGAVTVKVDPPAAATTTAVKAPIPHAEMCVCGGCPQLTAEGNKAKRAAFEAEQAKRKAAPATPPPAPKTDPATCQHKPDDAGFCWSCGTKIEAPAVPGQMSLLPAATAFAVSPEQGKVLYEWAEKAKLQPSERDVVASKLVGRKISSPGDIASIEEYNKLLNGLKERAEALAKVAKAGLGTEVVPPPVPEASIRDILEEEFAKLHATDPEKLKPIRYYNFALTGKPSEGYASDEKNAKIFLACYQEALRLGRDDRAKTFLESLTRMGYFPETGLCTVPELIEVEKIMDALNFVRDEAWDRVIEKKYTTERRRITPSQAAAISGGLKGALEARKAKAAAAATAAPVAK